MTNKHFSLHSTSTSTSWRWKEEQQAHQRREDRLIACGLMVCLLLQAVLLARPLWN